MVEFALLKRRTIKKRGLTAVNELLKSSFWHFDTEKAAASAGAHPASWQQHF
jgi:hypothetical protein